MKINKEDYIQKGFTQEEIVEYNIMIAKFMDWKLDETFPDIGHVYRSPRNNVELDTTLKFHKLWDGWLMPVIEKIDNMDVFGGKALFMTHDTTAAIGFSRGFKVGEIMDTSESFMETDENGCTHGGTRLPKNRIHGAYKMVVMFIKWYNSELEKNQTDNQ